MKNKKILVIAIIAIIVILGILIAIFNRPSDILTQEDKEIADDFEKLNNQVVDVTYNKANDEVSPNGIDLGDGFRVYLSDYKYNVDNDLTLKLVVCFSKDDAELVNVMYDNVLYNKKYLFNIFLNNYKQIKEFKKLKNFTEDYEQGCGMGMTRINDEETEINKSLKDMTVFTFYDEFEINDLSFSLYNIRYQLAGNSTWYSIDNDRVTFNINIDE